MAIKSKKFRPWSKRPDQRNGRQPDEWQRYFAVDEIEAFAEGFETPEMRKDRRRFWDYAKNERKRLERKAARDAYVPKTPVSRVRGSDYLHAPQSVRAACLQYWFFAHILPRGDGQEPLSVARAAKALGLIGEDVEQILIEPEQAVCDAAAAKAAFGEYPPHGMLDAQSGILDIAPEFLFGVARCPEPPKAVERFIDPVHHSLGLSPLFRRNAAGAIVQYGWDSSSYATGEAKVEQEIKAVASDPADYKSKLLSIFD